MRTLPYWRPLEKTDGVHASTPKHPLLLYLPESGYFITNDNLDAYNTIPHYVPEYAQFIKIMHNIYDDTQDHLPTKNPQAYAENQRRNVLQQDEKRKAEEDAFDLSALAEALSREIHALYLRVELIGII
jgi:hypothetical protein